MKIIWTEILMMGFGNTVDFPQTWIFDKISEMMEIGGF